MSAIDDVRELVSREPVGEGWVIAFHGRNEGSPDAYYRTIFVHPFRDDALRGGSLCDATLYPTYQEAAIAAAGWHHTRTPGTRIIHIKRSCPYEVMEDYPTNLVDALAEL